MKDSLTRARFSCTSLDPKLKSWLVEGERCGGCVDLDLRDWLLVLWARALAAHLEAYWLLLLWGLLLLLWLLRLHVVLVVVGCGWLFSGTSTAWILQVVLSLLRVPLVFLLLVPLLVRVRHVVVLL